MGPWENKQAVVIYRLDATRRSWTQSADQSSFVQAEGRIQEAVLAFGSSDLRTQWILVNDYKLLLQKMHGIPDQVVVTTFPAPSRAANVEHVLTSRQQEIAEYAAHGATAQEIADTLDISRYTVRQHLKAVYRRLGVANRVELNRALDGQLAIPPRTSPPPGYRSTRSRFTTH